MSNAIDCCHGLGIALQGADQERRKSFR